MPRVALFFDMGFSCQFFLLHGFVIPLCSVALILFFFLFRVPIAFLYSAFQFLWSPCHFVGIL